ncbi:SigB/SigF/SigG family RNA polymerase sigma factor [Nocardia veterana]|uniref:SigB/SigF/SigG family RNA polymerase sigma factor n=1 Tax=Nocardia veterana TaxID=132249 RepID=A0A7X6RI19_9NOCA|nr:SigB/SigF/SigG family RNA polymerase sigma factor [Nocardia veterana]NKY86660.1 SigB/SigF/SigG family RNA polymerase sigma factor [Nocardia veterana]
MATTPTAPRSDADRARRGNDPYDGIEESFRALAALDADDREREALREQIITTCMPLAEHIARRFAGRGQSAEDLRQVANLALVLAVDRFDVTRGVSFTSFAVPTIMGEVRRYFRDAAWAVKVPRRMKELRGDISRLTPVLAQRLGRDPSAHELARELDVSVEEVSQAFIASHSYLCDSLDESFDGEDDAPTPLGARLAVSEPCYELMENAMTVRPLLEALPERDRTILVQRFFERKTQTEIAALHGVSQMQISRLLTRILTSLREQALADTEPAASTTRRSRRHAA